MQQHPPLSACQPCSREPSSTAAWTEYYTNAAEAGECSSAAESIMRGHSVVSFDHLVTAAECDMLHAAATTAGEKIQTGRARSEASGGLSATLALRLEQPVVPTVTAGRVRMPVSHTFHRAIRSLVDELLLRTLEAVDAELPALSTLLGHTGLAEELRQRAATQQPPPPLAAGGPPLLSFTPNEPAINLYTSGGRFEAHRDLSLSLSSYLL